MFQSVREAGSGGMPAASGRFSLLYSIPRNRLWATTTFIQQPKYGATQPVLPSKDTFQRRLQYLDQ